MANPSDIHHDAPIAANMPEHGTAADAQHVNRELQADMSKLSPSQYGQIISDMQNGKTGDAAAKNLLPLLLLAFIRDLSHNWTGRWQYRKKVVLVTPIPEHKKLAPTVVAEA